MEIEWRFYCLNRAVERGRPKGVSREHKRQLVGRNSSLEGQHFWVVSTKFLYGVDHFAVRIWDLLVNIIIHIKVRAVETVSGSR
jgi:hypothetical protein